jgi:ABC-type multidrug transport system permease subunit
MQIIFSVFKFEILNMLRNFKSAGIMFILPVVFMGIFAFAFGSNSNILSFSVGIFQDKTQITNGAPDLSAIIKKVDDDSETIQINVVNYDTEADLNKAIEDEKVSVGAILSFDVTQNGKMNTSLVGKTNSTAFAQNKSIIEEILYSVTLPESSQIKTTQIGTTSIKFSVFNLLVPGLMIYGLLILIPGIAQSFTEFTEKNYVFRLKNSKAKSWQLIMGSVLYYMFLSIIQIIILYLTALAFGYTASGNVLYALAPALLTALFVIGMGLLIGSFVKKTEAATNIGTIVSIIFGFFSGSFISGIGQLAKFDLFGTTYEFNDLLPSKWGTTAIDKILAKNLGLSDITNELLVLFVSGVVVIIIGIVVYNQRQLKAQ